MTLLRELLTLSDSELFEDLGNLGKLGLGPLVSAGKSKTVNFVQKSNVESQ